jgi:hypothetical protein
MPSDPDRLNMMLKRARTLRPVVLDAMGSMEEAVNGPLTSLAEKKYYVSRTIICSASSRTESLERACLLFAN